MRESQEYSLRQNCCNKMSASQLASESHFESDDRVIKLPSIFRVPKILLKESKKGEAYVPERVSLGPYHHRSAKLRQMKKHKKRALERMMMRFNKSNMNLTNVSNNMDFSVRAKDAILQLGDKINYRYEENDCKGQSLAEMLSLDGCFILEILRTRCGDELPEAISECYEPLFQADKIKYTGFDILTDILKLENQIPLIVLQKLLQLELDSTADVVDRKLFKVLDRSFLLLFYPFDYKKDRKHWSWPQPGEQDDHLLGLLHRFIVSQQSHNGELAPGNNYQDEGSAVNDVECKIHGYMKYLLGLLHSLIVSPPSINGEREAQRAGYTTLPYQDEVNREGEDHNAVNIDVASWDRDEDHNTVNADAEECNIHRAVELGNAGVKFERSDGGIQRIKFDPKSATIYLPPITIRTHTEILFRNLIAFEMCKPSKTNYVASYVCLMGQLVASEEDVALLRKSGIVTNRLGSDGEVARLFNGLCKGVTVTVDLEDVFHKLTQNVNLHYRNKINHCFAELSKKYFSSPWNSLAFAGAILALLLTAVQTIVSILLLVD